MSFLMDMLSGAPEQCHEHSLLSQSPSSDGIELPTVGDSLAMEDANAPQLMARKSRGRLLVVASALMVVVVLLGGLSSSSSSNSPPQYKTPPPSSSTVITDGSVARKPEFHNPRDPNKQQQGPSTFLPPYTLEQILKNSYSPQARALQWVEAYPRFNAIRRWRKRQLMALATFYYSTGGDTHWPDEATKDWLSNTLHECNWKGDAMFAPECSSKKGMKGRYTRLELGMDTLKGTLPPELSMLTGLTDLELYGNDQLVGSIPSTWGKLTALTDLSLYNNRLDGPLPSELGKLSKLTVLNLDQNQFTGTLPSQLGGMTSITRLHLSDNSLTGTIPSVLKQLTSLQSIYLHKNRFNGTVSPSICYFASLEEIWVDCATVKCPCSQCLCAEDQPIPAIDETGKGQLEEAHSTEKVTQYEDVALTPASNPSEQEEKETEEKESGHDHGLDAIAEHAINPATAGSSTEESQSHSTQPGTR